ncbi:MAG: hypothetical protein JXQ71_11720 [Verrucomicrobia bacterium]|nr:hypothetical protein [Verrucomicrobiota bacterium]
MVAFGLGVLFLAALCTVSVAAPQVTQSIGLRAGWNAIWVEVEPATKAIEAVFAPVPEVEAVWAYFEKGSTADFIQNVNELPWNDPRWRRYFPTPNPKAVLNNLHTIDANRAYLVKTTNAATLVLTGRPSVRSRGWVPDAFNLRGFPVDPDRRPSFEVFFAPSAAHAGQAIYRLNVGGMWEATAGGSLMDSGEAYWVYSQGASDYTAPLDLRLEGGDGLDYGEVLNEQTIELRNHSANDVVVGMADYAGNAPAQGTMPLAYHDLRAPAGSNWVRFESPHAEMVPAGSKVTRRLAIRRSAMTGDHYEAVLYVADGAGTRYLCGLSAAKRAGAAGGGEGATGLWVGHAVINGVSDARADGAGNGGAGVTPTLATNGNGSEFKLRLVLHVETNGVTRLLKQVIQLWQDGAYAINPTNGLRQVDTNHPGRFVLVTDDARIADFTGGVLRDGEPVGRRISCAGLDFPDEPGQPANTRRMSGAFGLGGRLTTQFILPYDFPTHPFTHRRHPDHDNLGADLATVVAEAPDITRTMELEFLSQAPPGQSVADYGYDVIAGTYREVLRGLHQRDLVVTGTFRLNRISGAGELNPAKLDL